MCYQGKANSIRLCNEHSVNSRMLSVDCRHFKENLYTISLCRVNSLSWRMPNSVRMYHMFCLTSRPHTLFAFGCKPDYTIPHLSNRQAKGFIRIFSPTKTANHEKCMVITFFDREGLARACMRTRAHSHTHITSPPRADPNFIMHFTGKSEPAIFKWSAICRRSADWNV